MIMHGDTAFEGALLQLDNADHDAAAEKRASMILSMFCLDCTGTSLLPM